MIKIVQYLKNLLFLIPVTLVLSPLNRLFLFLSYFNQLIVWIHQNKSRLFYSDYFSLRRDYQKRYTLYEKISERYKLSQQEVHYLEFGVAGAHSFKWWMNENKNPSSRFAGFDTFEGLPENWGGFYQKGDMSYAVPQLDDDRGQFFKGLFQDTLQPYLDNNKEVVQAAAIRVLHLDADLYSATIYALSVCRPFLKKGDIILFDEFNVPMHEFKAYKEFVSNFYVQLTPIAAVNNFYQTAFVVE